VNRLQKSTSKDTVLIVSGGFFEEAYDKLQSINDTKVKKILIFTSSQRLQEFQQLIAFGIYPTLAAATDSFPSLTHLLRTNIESLGTPQGYDADLTFLNIGAPESEVDLDESVAYQDEQQAELKKNSKLAFKSRFNLGIRIMLFNDDENSSDEEEN